MARLIPAFEQFFDVNGDPLVKGKLYFYETGSSTTLKDTFSDVGETLKNTNPVILNADGRCPSVFGTGSYRVILTNKDTVQILQRDPVGGSGTQEFGADWISSITYQIGDIVRDGNYYYQGQSSNNTGNQPSTDGGTNWVTWPPNTQDAEIFRDEAEAARDVAVPSASSASTDAAIATTQAGIATTKAGEASDDADDAAASALSAANSAASSGKDFSATSTTSVAIGLGPTTFTIETGKGFVVGQFLQMSFDASNFMLGFVTAHDDMTGQLDVNITQTSGSGSYDSWGVFLGPSIQEQGSRLFVASGAISKTDTVTVNSDGTISSVTGVNEEISPEAKISTNEPNHIAMAYDSTNNKVVALYRNNNNTRGTAAVGTITGNSISWGAEVEFEINSVLDISACFDPDTGQVIVFYYRQSSGMWAVTGQVSGTTISFGTKLQVSTAQIVGVACAYDTNADRVLFLYRLSSGSFNLVSKVGTVSGSTISVGSEVTVSAVSSSQDPQVAFDPDTNQMLLIWKHDNGVTGFDVCAGLISGTSITYGATTQYEASINPTGLRIIYDTSVDKALVTFGSANDINVAVGSVSGTDFTLGTPIKLFASDGATLDLVYNPNDGNSLLVYEAPSDGYPRVVTLKSDGSTVSLATSPVIVNSADANQECAAAFNTSEGRYGIVYEDGGDGNDANSVVYRTPISNTDSTEFLGFALEGAADTGALAVATDGMLIGGLSGLTINTKYYVAPDGTLTTDNITAVYAGRAVSATEILVKENFA